MTQAVSDTLNRFQLPASPCSNEATGRTHTSRAALTQKCIVQDSSHLPYHAGEHNITLYEHAEQRICSSCKCLQAPQQAHGVIQCLERTEACIGLRLIAPLHLPWFITHDLIDVAAQGSRRNMVACVTQPCDVGFVAICCRTLLQGVKA